MPDPERHFYEKPRIGQVFVKRVSPNEVYFGSVTAILVRNDHWAAIITVGFMNEWRGCQKGEFWTNPESHFVPVEDGCPITVGEAKLLFETLLAAELAKRSFAEQARVEPENIHAEPKRSRVAAAAQAG